MNVRTIEEDSESGLRRTQIDLRGNLLHTPARAVNLSKLSSRIIVAPQSRGVAEIFRRIDEERLERLMKDPKALDRFNYQLNSDQKKRATDESTFCFIEYDGSGYPSGKKLELISDTAYEYSDMTPLPLVADIRERVTSDADFKSYTSFLGDSIETIEQLNKHPIMGVIPPLAITYIPDLVEFYQTNGINSFCLDLGGKNPISMKQTIRTILRTLNSEKMLEKSLILAVNVGPGRAAHKSGVVPAKDILSFGVGIDILCGYHRPKPMNEETIKKMKLAGEKPFRLFNKADYGYHRGGSDKWLEGFIPKDSEFTATSFSGDDTSRRLAKDAFNAEQQSLEAIKLGKILRERTQSPLGYVSKKANVAKEDVDQIRRIREFVKTKAAKQTKLWKE